MKNVLNLFFILLVLIFFWSTYDYYSSNKNIKVKEFNHKNIDEIINKNISNIPILKNDTKNVIEFNNSITSKTNIDKPRNFWDLLKSK